MGTYSGTVYDLSGTNGFSRVFNWSNIGSHRVRLDVTGTKNPLSSQTLYSLSGRFVSTGATSRSLSGFEFRGEESNSGGLTNGTIERTGIVTLNDAVVPTGLSFSATNTQNTGAWISVDDVVSFADQYTASATKGFYTK